MGCPNTNSPQWKDLVDRIGVREAYREYAKYGDIPDSGAYPSTFSGVNATLKVIGALSTDKMQQVYNKFYSGNKDKFYAELMQNGATKDQIELLKAWNVNNNPQSLADMQAGIAAEMSYTVEIKESTVSRSDYSGRGNYDNWANDEGFDHDDTPYYDPDATGQEPTSTSVVPTSHYSGMTVPGGTNYRENEIRTPDITPVRQGHAQFSTPNGIGWFRSDDRRIDDNTGKKVSDGAGGLIQLGQVAGNTRRILEIQSDLFQKERSNESLAAEIAMPSNEFMSTPTKDITSQENRFLQVLNKDNNWVTFFTKAIIQDSTRKGYENVLFPAGNTAAKVEGHETLEEFLANSQRSIDDLSRRLQPGGLDNWFNSKADSIQGSANVNRRYSIEDNDEVTAGYARDQQAEVDYMKANREKILEDERKHVTREVEHIKQEMEDARAGRTQLSSIASFYENTLQNVLNKQKYGPTRITDEYGNEWFQVRLQDAYRETIYFNRQTPSTFEKGAVEFLQKEGLINLQQESVGGQKEWVIANTGGNDKTVSMVAQNYQRIEALNYEYHNSLGLRPFSIEQIGDKYVVRINRDTVVFNKDMDAVEATKADTIRLLDRLQEKTGLPYAIITLEQAQDITKDAANPVDETTAAFFYKGKTYLLEDNISPDNAFHEYAHPFVSALRQDNPALFGDLIHSLASTPEGRALYATVLKLYEGIPMQDIHEEVIVRALTDVAQGNLSFQSPEGKSFWNKLWFNIKQFFRKMFGQSIDLSKLDANTSLRDLASMLLNEKKVDLAKHTDDYVLMNRDIAKEMDSIPEHDSVRAIETFHRVAQDHLSKMRENMNYNELREVLKNQADGSILQDINKLLALSKQKEEEMDDNFKKLNNFARAVVGARMLSEKMRNHVIDMASKDMDERDRLRTMRYYSFISNDWLQAFDQLREINKTDLPLLGDEIGRATNNFRRINDHVAQAFKGGLVQTLMEQLRPLNDNVQKELGPQVDKVRKEVLAGNTKLQARLDYLEKMYKHGTFDEDKILKLLQGELGDTNWASSMFESYTSSPDPVVGGFASYINKELYKVEAGIQETTTNMGNELAPLYKQYGVDVSKPEELGKQLVFKDTAFTKDEDGNPKGHEVHTYLHEFANGYQYDYQNLQHQIDAAKEGGNKEESIKLQKQFDQLRKDYFHREYVDDVYNAKEFWNESDINRLAQQRRKDITDQLAGYEAESNFKDLEKEDYDHIDQLLTELKTLSSTKNLDGSDKTGDDLGVAQAIQEYNKRMMQFREEMPMKGAFERDMQTQKDDLLDKGLPEGSQEYKDGMNAWLKQNLRVRLSDEFYNSRNAITDEIAKIVGQLSQDQAKQLDVSNSWKEMFEQLKGFRDQDNQPVGTSLSTDKIREVKKLQEKINDIVSTLRRLNGLTNEEQERYSELWGKLIAGNPLDPSESNEFDELVNRKKLLGLSPVDKARLMSLFEELKQFQSKIPTEYYLQAINQKLAEANIQGEVTMHNAEDYLNADAINQFLEANPDNPFVKWFKDNHIERVKWDSTTQTNKMMYERLYSWNRIVPNDDDFKTALANNDYQKLLELKNPLIQIRPSSKYFFYRIKSEYRTKREVGKTTDNKGNWLPRTMEQGAKDGKYRNEGYYKLKGSNDPKQKALYNILETYKKYHLQSQVDAPKYTRLWYEIPRVRREEIENIEGLVTSPAKSAKNIISWFASQLSNKSKSDAFDQGIQSRKDMDRENKMYVATDLFGNEINSIPMKYMSKLDADLVSMDLGRSTIKYTLAQQVNKMLHDVNPFAQALKQTLAEEGIKSINKMSTRNWGSKFMNIPVLDRNNVRLKTINNMIERDIEGIENHMELGLFGSKVAKHLMGVAAFGSLAINLPAGIKNVVTAKLQNLTESNSKEFFSAGDLRKADNLFMKRFMPKLIHDYNSFSGRSLETQMFELFDFVQGKFEEHVGESFSASYKKDIAHLRFTRSFQTLGELQAQGQAGLAMMLRQQVPWHHDGVTTPINYIDAWELKNGTIQLKDGVDARWGRQGDEFAAFKLRMHKINELMQGAYSKMNQSEASRYTSFKLLNFMRRYLVPGIANRFTVNRNNVALGTQREGYFTSSARMILETARTRMQSWHTYSDKEKRNVYKTLTELGYSLSFALLISMMGYNGDDPDKNKKLKGSSWAQNMALYELVMIKGEVENFIPIPGMGVNEILRMKDQPSIAFPLLNKYYKIVSHLIDLMQQPFSQYDLIHYRQSSGIYKKGDLKLMADLLKTIGYTGATLHPDVAVKNYMATTNRYN